MKTILITTLSILFFVSIAEAQYARPTRTFKKGQLDLQAGIGLAPTFFQDGGSVRIPPMSLAADFWLSDQVSLGLFGGFSETDGPESELTDGQIAQWRNAYSEVGVRFGAHFTRTEDLDIYGGLRAGIAFSHITPLKPGLEKMMPHLGIQEYNSEFLYTAYLGIRYALAPKWTIYSELSYGLSILQVGLGYKLI